MNRLLSNTLIVFILAFAFYVPIVSAQNPPPPTNEEDRLTGEDPENRGLEGANTGNELMPPSRNTTQIDTSIIDQPVMMPTMTVTANRTDTFLDRLVPPSVLGDGTGNPLNTILNQLLFLGLVVAVVLALVMIVRGGVEYMTVDAVASKESGKKRVQAALGGLLLAFSTIVILNTINPNITELNVQFPGLKAVKGIDLYGTNLTSETKGGTGLPGVNQSITPTTDGYEATPGRVAIDTDGTERPPFNDPHWQGQTSYPGLNANTDNYVVVPIGSDIPLGTKVKMYNADTGTTVWGIVGDRGPTANGLGELSLNAARELGAWTDGMGNSAKQHKITYTFYTNEPKEK